MLKSYKISIFFKPKKLLDPFPSTKILSATKKISHAISMLSYIYYKFKTNDFVIFNAFLVVGDFQRQWRSQFIIYGNSAPIFLNFMEMNISALYLKSIRLIYIVYQTSLSKQGGFCYC